jgi:spore coat protein JB
MKHHLNCIWDSSLTVCLNILQQKPYDSVPYGPPSMLLIKARIKINMAVEDTNMKQMDEQYYELLHEIQQIDFVILELNLYLNTHPNDQMAIAQYNECVQKSMHLKKNFEAIYGPLTSFGYSYSKVPWQWNKAPWPWQV